MSKTAIALAAAAFLALSGLIMPGLSPAAGSGEGEGQTAAPSSRNDGEEGGLPIDAGRAGRSSGLAIWHPDRILDAGARLNDAAAGDFVTGRPGNETLAADASGNLWLAWREDYQWRSRVAWNAGGNLTSLAEGELDGSVAGREAAAAVSFGNGTGAVYVVSWPGDQAVARPAVVSTAGMTAVAAGDVITGFPGAEVVAVDDGGNVSVLFPNAPANGPQNILRVQGASCLAVADLDNLTRGDEVVVGTSTGEILELYWSGWGWEEKGLWVSNSGVTCLVFGEADPLHDGPELAIGSASGEITLLERLGDTWSGRSVGKLAGPVLAISAGDADADLPGNELLASIAGNILRLRWDGNAWDRATLWSGPGSCGRLAVVEVDPDHGGNELLAAGPSGNLTALGLYHPGFSMSAGTSRLALAGGETASYELFFTPVDKLGGNLTLSLGALPAGIAISSGAGPVALTPPNISRTLNLTVAPAVRNGEYRFLVTASSGAGIFDSAWLTLALDRSLDLKVSMRTGAPTVEPGSTAVYTVTVSNTGTVNDSYRLEARAEGGWAVKFPAGNLTGRLAPGENRSLELRVSVPGDAAGRTVKLSVNATSFADANLTRSASMKVIVPQKTGPCGLFILPAGLVGTAYMLGKKRK